MQVNMSDKDKQVRGIIGIVLIVIAFWLSSWVPLVIGAVLLVTVFMGFCPLYLPLGIDTTKCCKKDAPEQPVQKATKKKK